MASQPPDEIEAALRPLSPGDRLGRYLLLRRLAVGGMAEIFLARNSGIEGFEKTVVLKSILPVHAADDEFIRMFLDEARLAGTLHHPNIAQVFDIGCEGGKYFFTMEYVYGLDLRRVLKKAARGEGLPLEQAIAIAIGACAGLHYAHEKVGATGKPLGIVHRDVSASNVIVSYDGGVKIVDFGIAKAASHRTATRTGTIKGKLACMSPEQCRGDALDRRSDIFSIGILLFEMTTGTRVYDGESDYALLHQIVDKDPPLPSSRRSNYPPALEAIVARAMRRARDERYATAQELQIDLETFARDQQLVTSPVELARYMEGAFGPPPEPGAPPDETPPPGSERPALYRRPKSRAPLAIAAGVALAMGALGAFLGQRGRADPPIRNFLPLGASPQQPPATRPARLEPATTPAVEILAAQAPKQAAPVRAPGQKASHAATRPRARKPRPTGIGATPASETSRAEPNLDGLFPR